MAEIDKIQAALKRSLKVRLHESRHEMISDLSRRQHRRPHGELPRHAPHGLEGVPAAAVRPAGHRGVRRGGGRGLPEEAGAKQEVLLSGEAEQRELFLQKIVQTARTSEALRDRRG